MKVKDILLEEEIPMTSDLSGYYEKVDGLSAHEDDGRLYLTLRNHDGYIAEGIYGKLSLLYIGQQQCTQYAHLEISEAAPLVSSDSADVVYNLILRPDLLTFDTVLSSGKTVRNTISPPKNVSGTFLLDTTLPAQLSALPTDSLKSLAQALKPYLV